MYTTELLVGLLAIINIYTFLMMGNDKRKSVRKKNSRIPEGYIFFIAILFGSVGVYAGMLLFRHKTKHWYFQLGIPLLILQNAATLYAVWLLTADWW